MAIKNIIFDFGNVLVRWAPYEVIETALPSYNSGELFDKMKPVWIDLNLGKLTTKEAINLYHQQLNIPLTELENLMREFCIAQTKIPGSHELLQELKEMGTNLYAITDNIKEIITYHKSHSNFLHYFKDIVVSADVGILKPDKKIYQYLLDRNNIDPAESVFIDDIEKNVEGAKQVGMQAFQFTDAKSCRKKLISLGIKLSDDV